MTSALTMTSSNEVLARGKKILLTLACIFITSRNTAKILCGVSKNSKRNRVGTPTIRKVWICVDLANATTKILNFAPKEKYFTLFKSFQNTVFLEISSQQQPMDFTFCCTEFFSWGRLERWVGGWVCGWDDALLGSWTRKGTFFFFWKVWAKRQTSIKCDFLLNTASSKKIGIKKIPDFINTCQKKPSVFFDKYL